MPLLLLLAGAGGGFFVSKGVEQVNSLVKWLLIGGALFFAAKFFKVIK